MSALAFDGTPNNTAVGYFTYTVADERWTWSDELYSLHGYEPGAVEASAGLMIQHKHPEDAARTIDVLEEAVSTGDPFSCYHRIVDAKSRVRSVLSVGRGVKDHRGEVVQVTGFFVDLTQVRREETQQEVDAALLAIARTRLVIEQAKGIVMAAAGCNADDAFAILRSESSLKNVKLNAIAYALVELVAAEQPLQNGRVTLRELLNASAPDGNPPPSNDH